jgi:protein-L-isoaspartate(D-aspartate) O-methyltransferase
MVRRQIAARGITDRRVLAALASVPREHFVPEHLLDQACTDTPLPAGHGQTISQPFMVALMTTEARLGRRSRVLEIGTGTGYHAAVLARIAGHVWTLERVPQLSTAAQRRLTELEIANVTCLVGDGAQGYPAEAPYDAIVVAAAAPVVPPLLLRQLAPGGRLVIPVGDRIEQRLLVYQATDAGYRVHDAGPCRFVPLLSPDAFRAE